MSAIAIIANGESVLKHDLQRIPQSVKVLTLNRAWSLRMWPDYHMALETAQAKEAPSVYEDMAQRGILWVAGSDWLPLVKKGAHELKYRSETNKLWSWEMDKGIVEGFAGTGSVTYAAMQLACMLGFTTLHMLGLDLGPTRFDGSKSSPRIEAQRVLFQTAYSSLRKRGLEAFLVGSPESKVKDIPHMTFEDMLRREGGEVTERKAMDQPAMAEPQ